MSLHFSQAIVRAQKVGSDAASFWVGHHLTVVGMTTLVTGWIAYGMVAGFTREWFLLCNMFGTLMAFLILLFLQHARSRHTLAVQAKLDELIHSSEAGNHWIGVERYTPARLEEMRARHQLAAEAGGTVDR